MKKMNLVLSLILLSQATFGFAQAKAPKHDEEPSYQCTRSDVMRAIETDLSTDPQYVTLKSEFMNDLGADDVDVGCNGMERVFVTLPSVVNAICHSHLTCEDFEGHQTLGHVIHKLGL